MIHNRIRGISNLVMACQGLVTLFLFWSWILLFHMLVPSSKGADLKVYGGYSLLIVVGLWLDSLRHQPANVPFTVRRPSLIGQLPLALRQTAVAIGFLFLMLVLGKDRTLSRLFLLTFIPVFYLMLLISGHLLPGLFIRTVFRGRREERLILIGSPTRAAAVREWLLAKQEYGFRAVGILTDEQHFPNPWPNILGSPTQLDAILEEQGATQVMLLQPPEATPGLDDLLEIIYKRGIRLTIFNNLDEQLHHPVVAFEDDGLKFFTLHSEPLENPFSRVVKRIVDLAIALPAVLVILPIASAMVKIFQIFQSPGPLFYRQTRSGIQNRGFEIVKFRTMHPDNPDNQEQAKQATVGDRRIFTAGRFLRRFSLDELPQFLNVLSGEMSVVGPRPHLVEHNDRFAALLSEYHIRAFVKPGITGLAQVRKFRGEIMRRADIEARLKSDLVYVENWSLTLDCTIILRTFWQVVFPPLSAR
jgi:exopolysaccharide biosynthesis polyprenyl glycosylphosphotransferase